MVPGHRRREQLTAAALATTEPGNVEGTFQGGNLGNTRASRYYAGTLPSDNVLVSVAQPLALPLQECPGGWCHPVVVGEQTLVDMLAGKETHGATLTGPESPSLARAE